MNIYYIYEYLWHDIFCPIYLIIFMNIWHMNIYDINDQHFHEYSSHLWILTPF